MISEISAAVTSVSAAVDIIRGLNATKTEAAINSVRIELQGLMLGAQQGLFAAQTKQHADAQQIASLEQEIARLKDWSAKRSRYTLADVDDGALVYVPKPGMDNDEPPHWLCANCFTKGTKSFLQNQSRSIGPGGRRGADGTFACNACKASVQVSYRITPAHPE